MQGEMKGPRIYRSSHVKKRLGDISTATLYRLMGEGFPTPRGKIGGSNVWDVDEVDAWIAAKLGMRRED